MCISLGDSKEEYEILKLNEFSSDRRMMSVVVKRGDSIKMYAKGADQAIH